MQETAKKEISARCSTTEKAWIALLQGLFGRPCWSTRERAILLPPGVMEKSCGLSRRRLKCRKKMSIQQLPLSHPHTSDHLTDSNTGLTKREANTDFETDDCCGFDPDYWVEDVADGETEDD